jgi:ABC-type sugar transport system permease subunit
VKSRYFPYLLLAPATLLLLAVSLYPSLYSLFLSLNTFRRGDRIFVGLRNFQQLFRSDDFWESLRITAVYGVIFVFLTLVIAFILALLFNQHVRFNAVYMTIIFIPWMLSEVVTGVIFRWLFLPGYGLMQDMLSPLFGGISFLGHPVGALGVVIGATVWRTIAFAMILLLAGLQTIPKDANEAAAIDGANSWQTFRFITWPLMRSTTMVVILLLTLQAVNATGVFLSITNGGPGRATEVLSISMYREALLFFNFGYGAAIAVVMLMVNLALAVVYVRTMRDDLMST